jgi:hypothetical protein
MDYMHCTTCGFLVQVNPTGTCLSCQGGFGGPKSDRWTPADIVPEKKGILDITCEVHDAIEERLKQEDSAREHQDGNSSGKGTEASSSDRPKRRRKVQKKA